MIYLDPTIAAQLARIAGAELNLEHGLTYRGKAINADAIGWFLAGRYGIEVATELDGRRILAAGRGLAAIEQSRARADAIAELLRELTAEPAPALLDQFKAFEFGMRELLAR
jgi:hypothetical protein